MCFQFLQAALGGEAVKWRKSSEGVGDDFNLVLDHGGGCGLFLADNVVVLGNLGGRDSEWGPWCALLDGACGD